MRNIIAITQVRWTASCSRRGPRGGLETGFAAGGWANRSWTIPNRLIPTRSRP